MNCGVLGIVLVGGHSARFGGDKALATLASRTMLESVCERTAPQAEHLLINLNGREQRSGGERRLQQMSLKRNAMSQTKGTRTIGTTTFRIRKARLSRTYFVEVLQIDATSQRLGSFETRLRAEDWVRTESARWLADQIRSNRCGPVLVSR